MKTSYVRNLMRKKKITRVDLAKKMGKSERTIYRYLSGQCNQMTKIAMEVIVEAWEEK